MIIICYYCQYDDDDFVATIAVADVINIIIIIMTIIMMLVLLLLCVLYGSNPHSLLLQALLLLPILLTPLLCVCVLCGGSPTELDAMVFGHLFTLLTTSLPEGHFAEIVQQFPNLTAFCRKIDEKYFKQN